MTQIVLTVSYFLSKQKLVIGQAFLLSGEEAGHIMLSRRIKPGEHIFIQGPDFQRFEAEVVTASKQGVELKIIAVVKVPEEPRLKVTLFQAVVSEKALDFIFQKGTELGASEIILFNSVRTATKLSADQFQKKYDRWNKILWEAAKQSDRLKPPELRLLDNIHIVAEESKKYQALVILDPSGTKRLKDINFAAISSAAIFIGPEGGLTREEIELLSKLPNSEVYNLGAIILKAETASLASLAAIMNL